MLVLPHRLVVPVVRVDVIAVGREMSDGLGDLGDSRGHDDEQHDRQEPLQHLPLVVFAGPLCQGTCVLCLRAQRR